MKLSSGGWWALSIVLVGCASAEPEDAKKEDGPAPSASSANGDAPALFRGDATEQAAIADSLIPCERFSGPNGFELRTSFPDRVIEIDASVRSCPASDGTCMPQARFSVVPVTTESGTEWELRLRHDGDPMDASYATYRIVLGTTKKTTGEEVKYVRSLVGEGRTLQGEGSCVADPEHP